MTENVIETENLTKFYGERCAVYRVNLRVPRGVVYGFLGPNGAGKSTTIGMLVGCLRPTYGKVRIFGLDVFRHRTKIMERVGYLPEKPVAYRNMRVEEFLEYMGRLEGLSRGEAREKARELLGFVGLGRLAMKKVETLSAGERQRLGFAQALIGDPELLILDEPTSNLDPVARFEILSKIRWLASKKGVTTFISSHVIPEVSRVSDYVGIINNGSLIAQGHITDLVAQEEDEYIVRVSDPKRLIDRLRERDYVLEVVSEGKDGVRLKVDINNAHNLWIELPELLVEERLALYEFKPIGDPLEKLFLRKLGVFQ
ncbi:MAG: ABC transporter ATP-binding protein [Thermoprotei archaeon]|nr:MAG: ABC transporter ATP-binding protein [Thermoprotei archaeon]RLF20092.1 MAG: ABC transporter ATP-binding protein [Thermoprotei archaeon]